MKTKLIITFDLTKDGADFWEQVKEVDAVLSKVVVKKPCYQRLFSWFYIHLPYVVAINIYLRALPYGVMVSTGGSNPLSLRSSRSRATN